MVIEEAIAAYVKLRDYKALLESKHKEIVKPYTDAMAKIEARLMQYMQDQGLTSVKGGPGVGTAYVQTVHSVTVADWNQALNFVRESGEWGMLEARMNKTAVQDYLDSTNELPPGVNMKSATVVRVRR